MSKLRIAGVVILAAAVLFIVANALAIAFPRTVSATAECPVGQEFVGVFVDSLGHSDFANDWQAEPGQPHIAKFTFKSSLLSPSKLLVGCAGTRQVWGSKSYSPSLFGNGPFYIICAATLGDFAGSCRVR